MDTDGNALSGIDAAKGKKLVWGFLMARTSVLNPDNLDDTDESAGYLKKPGTIFLQADWSLQRTIMRLILSDFNSLKALMSYLVELLPYNFSLLNLQGTRNGWQGS